MIAVVRSSCVVFLRGWEFVRNFVGFPHPFHVFSMAVILAVILAVLAFVVAVISGYATNIPNRAAIPAPISIIRISLWKLIMRLI